MLQSNHRLRRPADINLVRQAGNSWRHPLLILLVRSNSLPVSRFAFVASRHVGKAVQRNRAKRLLREAVRAHLPEIQPGWDCVLIARPSLPQAAFGEVETAVTQLLQRAKLRARP
ncbi:MAG TPA: ribonuclease P protein component [Chloroflexota bacterium]|nr:ribonuclease P protein component [Chloroflexota bacterium]